MFMHRRWLAGLLLLLSMLSLQCCSGRKCCPHSNITCFEPLQTHIMSLQHAKCTFSKLPAVYNCIQCCSAQLQFNAPTAANSLQPLHHVYHTTIQAPWTTSSSCMSGSLGGRVRATCPLSQQHRK
jgi:hypothetical protein